MAKGAMSQYLFDNAGPQAAERFSDLAALYDPVTVRHLEALEVSKGWQCLEVGGGGGSIADWLAHRVGTRGHVLVTDIDPRYLVALKQSRHTNISVQRHDVEYDPLPSDTFDLIHARLVLVHVATAAQVLRKLVVALRPGGWLLVEDFDLTFLDPTFLTKEATAAAIYQTATAALAELMTVHGSPHGWGRALYQHLRTEGLLDVGMEGHLTAWPGGSVGAHMMRANFDQVQEEALERGLVSEEGVEKLLAVLDDPVFAASSPMMFSAWGRRPAG